MNAVDLLVLMDRYRQKCVELQIAWEPLFDEASALAVSTGEPFERHIERLFVEALANPESRESY